jgi:hypothetical protein
LGKPPSFFTIESGGNAGFFVKPAGKMAGFHFSVALKKTDMYNNKSRQAEGASKRGGRTPEGRFQAAEGTPYADDERVQRHPGPVHYSGSGTGSFAAETE